MKESDKIYLSLMMLLFGLILASFQPNPEVRLVEQDLETSTEEQDVQEDIVNFADPNQVAQEIENKSLYYYQLYWREVEESEDEQEVAQVTPEVTVAEHAPTQPQVPATWTDAPEGDTPLTAYAGVTYNANGNRETYYNLPMDGIVSIMRSMGFSEEEYPYWVRDDGVKMLGPYVMVAANLNTYPRGTTVYTSLGTGLVCDTGGFAANNPMQLDIATSW